MLEGKAPPTAPFKLFPGRICSLSAKHKAPEGGAGPQLGFFWAGDAKDWDVVSHIKAKEMGRDRGVCPWASCSPSPQHPSKMQLFLRW